MARSQLCELCRGITAEALVSSHGYAHAPRPEDLGNRGYPGCDLCEQLGMDYVPDWNPEDDIDPDNNSGFSKWDLRLSITIRDPEVYYLRLTSEIWPGPDEEWTQDMDAHYLMTPEGDPAAEYGIPTMVRDMTNTRSPETFEFIKSCMWKCDNNHNCTLPLELGPVETRMRKTDEPVMLRPTRLIALNAKDESSVRLIQVNEQNCPSYMTLSHRWGSNMPATCLTTESNVAERTNPFAIANLPPTFRDAIEITRRLDFLHLWIDTLCIIQDSKSDWATESVKMGGIYQNSAVNIAASHAEDSFGGCFNKQSVSRVRASDISRRPSDNIEIKSIDSSGRETTLILYRSPFGDMPGLVEESPLHKRGWTFQERVLAPRTVHFTSTQVLWECRREYWFEDRIPWKTHGERRQPMSAILRPDMEDHTKSTKTLFTGDKKIARITDHWYDRLVADRYSARKFTQPSDRLVALAGIAAVYQQLTQDKYIAGLWTSAMVTGLTWKKYGIPLYEDTSTESRRWPTWSWASQDDRVQFLTVGTHPQSVVQDPAFKLIDAQLVYGSGHINEFSPVVGGFITVRGCLVELLCEKSSCKFPGDWELGWEGHYSFDKKSKDSVKSMTVLALAVGIKASETTGDRFVLLEPYKGQGRSDSFTRIGIAHVEYSPHMARGGWQDTTEKALQLRAARTPRFIHLY